MHRRPPNSRRNDTLFPYTALFRSAFLAGWNPPERIAAQIADPDWTVALVRGAGGAILGFVKLGPIDFALPPGQPSDDATELHQLYVGAAAKEIGRASCRERVCQYV